MTQGASAVFVAQDGEWVPTGHARGPWSPDECHGGAPAALLARELERTEPGADMVVMRAAYEFLGPVPIAPLRVEAQIVKPGKRLQVLEGRIWAAEREVVRVRATRLRRGDGVAASPLDSAQPLPPPESAQVLTPFAGLERGEAFHPTAVDIRVVSGERGSGASTAWFRLVRPLVAGEVPSGLQRAAAAADFGNGISHVLPFPEWLFVNTDLTIQLHREPVGDWIALEARTDVSGEGVGASLSILHDARGRFGAAAQSLNFERR